MVRSARTAWSFLFTLSMLLAWVLRDFAKPLLMKIPCAHVCDFGRFVAWENKRGQGGHARMGRARRWEGPARCDQPFGGEAPDAPWLLRRCRRCEGF